MKKQSFATVIFLSVLLCSLSLMIVPSAFAKQTPNSSTYSSTPRAEGGGCSNPESSSRNDIQNLKACISYDYPKLLSDAYVTFRHLSGHGIVKSCTITIYLFDFDSSTVLAQQSYNCLPDALGNATNKHYGPFGYAELSGTYYSFAEVTLTYNDNSTSNDLSNDSPVQNIP
jgi:hypothetical protein